MLLRLLRLLWDVWLLLWLLLGHRLGNRWRVLLIAIGRSRCRRLYYRRSLVRKTCRRKGAKRKAVKINRFAPRRHVFPGIVIIFFNGEWKENGRRKNMEINVMWCMTYPEYGRVIMDTPKGCGLIDREIFYF